MVPSEKCKVPSGNSRYLAEILYRFVPDFDPFIAAGDASEAETVTAACQQAHLRSTQ
jgi:hypothetical protein